MRNRIEEDYEDSMPVVCKCGDVWDLTDMHRSPDPFASNDLICPECYKTEFEEYEKQVKIECILDDIENGYVGKREGNKRLKELGYKKPKT